MKEFYVGQRVLIREWDDMASEFEVRSGRIMCKYRFPTDMKFLCGESGVIVGVDGYQVSIDFDDDSIQKRADWYTISTDMICDYSDVEDISIDEEELISFLSG